MASSIAMTAPWPRKGVIGCAASPNTLTSSPGPYGQGVPLAQRPFEQEFRGQLADDAQHVGMKFLIEFKHVGDGGVNGPPFFFPARLAAQAHDVHDRPLAEQVPREGTVGAAVGFRRRFQFLFRETVRGNKRAQGDMSGEQDGFRAEYGRAHRRVAAVAADENVAAGVFCRSRNGR